ncbi:gamma-glutamyltransferase [Acuticoccus sediminis]|uniref:Glutathione hydrolase proenzyme n=1 Tax=Acuticoccus sediminis TaxID=2184697 RepID=A0A8B2NYM6_9HYPH|nr:gamma-glutamyltransferase [Acuticoccus sediminis]RAI03941.1 gamma-glutamyltransferase [Acuticoccus sediminis]
MISFSRLDRITRRVSIGAFSIILAVAVAVPAGAQEATGGQRFVPIRAEEYMVVSQERQASEVGRDIMRRGGNAIDAAVATAFALAVTLPRAGNLGGGGFMVVHRGDTGETVAIDARETAPAASDRDMFLNAEGEADPELSRRSGLAVGVPGTVAGLALAHERYGSGTLTFAELVAPAIALARDGFVVSADTSAALASPDTAERLLADPNVAAYYPGGAAPIGGDTLKLPVLAGTLQAIADNGPSAFYEGEIAQGIVDAVTERGGRMTLEDLGNYEAKLREPVHGTFKDYEVFSMPPPSSGGVHLVQILNTLEDQPFGTYGLNSAEMIHVMVEAMKYAYADRAHYLGDPDFVDVPVKALTSKAYAHQIAARIDMTRATPSSEIAADPGALPYESNETTHFSVVDDAGNAVSMTTTLNFSFGVGFGTAGGFLLNNELDDFSAKPGVPNAYGLIGGDANAVEPDKRPLSSMTPTILLKDGEVSLVTGSPGGSRIITTVLQVILNATVHERNIATATNAPRIHHQWLPDYIRIEEGISHDTIRLLEDMGHEVRVMDSMGSAQSIQVGAEGELYGASDPRRPGGAAVGD